MEQSIKDIVLAQNKAVPRYTSYPTAPHFKDGFSEAVYRDWLVALKPEQSLSLYVHIPFCAKLCWFCGCNTKITLREGPVADYVELILREIEMVSQLCAKGMKVKQLHFGGGSPTILKPGAFEKLMAALRRNFTFMPNAEIAVEIDPRTLTPELAAMYGRCGVNRASIGVQDFDERVMKAVNRPQPYEVVKTAMDLARASGIASMNIDLMYGLPYQNAATMKKLVEQAVTLDPDRLTMFGYAHVPWMKKHMRLIPDDALPDNSLRYDLFEIGARLLEDAGYMAIGIDHFAKPDDALAKALQLGKMHRNFQGYTTDDADALIGFGSSAISRLSQGYVQNTIHGPQYRDRIEAGILPAEKYCVLTEDDRLRADVIERLICDMKVNLNDICRRHERPISSLTQDLERLEPVKASGLVHRVGNHISIDKRQMVRLACAAFDTYLSPDGPKRHVSSV